MELLRTWEKNGAARRARFLCCQIWAGSSLAHFLPSHGSGCGSGRGRAERTDLAPWVQTGVERGGSVTRVEHGHGSAQHAKEALILHKAFSYGDAVDQEVYFNLVEAYSVMGYA